MKLQVKIIDLPSCFLKHASCEDLTVNCHLAAGEDKVPWGVEGYGAKMEDWVKKNC